MNPRPALLTVPAPGADVLVVTTAPLVHLCPHVDEVDTGQARLSWVTEGSTIELHSLAAYLESWADERIGHEELTETIASALRVLEGISSPRARLTYTTAGILTEVTSLK